ncbi:unnamed protein product [Meganyctiphanes norvegica]|uniref:CUB domain-containing protein n=1 Tax=Meganyctiphanes norvegica TaxID=48144 RepID=A0AAV2QF02_MEGNR
MRWFGFFVLLAFTKAVPQFGSQVHELDLFSQRKKEVETYAPVASGTEAQDTTEAPTQTETPVVVTSPPEIPNCGATIDGSVSESGIITTPNYPNQYSHGLYCIWKIKGGKGKRVRLSFEDFEVTGTPGCEDDHLIVSTSGDKNDEKAARLCGSDNPDEYLTGSDTMYIEFRSAPSGDTCRGFSAKYILEEVTVTCGEDVSFLEFDFLNPEYPKTAANETSHCELPISHACEVPICQLRLEFIELELQPPELGNCDNDQFMVQANEPTPTLCGINNGHHMYIDVAGRASTSLHVLTTPIIPKPWGHYTDVSTGYVRPIAYKYEIENNRRWRIRVNQIPCDPCEDPTALKHRAPTGCLQYFEEITDVIKTFNFDGSKLDYNPCWNGTEKHCGRRQWTGHLNNLDYHVCVRVADGYCGIMYDPLDTESFFMTGEAKYNETAKYKNLYGSGDCQADYIVVPKSRTPGDNDPWSHDRFCGTATGNYVRGPLVSYSTPFYMQVKTDEDEFSHSLDTENRGFGLRYTQLPCSGPYLFNSDQKFVG